MVDLHADSLLWNRDLSQRHQQGYIDLPRLQDANVALQAFTVVTKVPSHLKLGNNAPQICSVPTAISALGKPS